jgi:peptidoglycan hydrolase-like protein with peptidoglycan-binding domain
MGARGAGDDYGRVRAIGLALVLGVGLLVPATAQAGRADVAALQVAMRALDLYPSSIDGIAGPLTRNAVRTFQRRRGLVVDGIAGPQTRRALGRRGRPRLGSRAMRNGMRGWDVAALQFLLSSRGYGPGGFDGGFGPNTDNAVRRYQSAAGLAVDGVAGPMTLRALRQRRTYSPGDPVRFLRPISTSIGDGFGWVSGRRHTGLDYPAGYGSRVGAAGRGRVVFAGWNSGGYGNLVVIRHRLGFESWYAHLATIAVRPGQWVVGGNTIGYVGSTGRSTGPHLHFEVRRFGTPIDPVPRLLTAAAAGRPPKRSTRRKLICRPNADARRTKDADPPVARFSRCP